MLAIVLGVGRPRARVPGRRAARHHPGGLRGLQILYSAFLKHLPVVDLAVVASGFLLRAIAGGVATGIPLSQWFLLVASFGSFFMVAGKRYSEMKSLGAEAGTRRSLTRYSESYLRFAWMLAAVMVVISYSLWAFENRGNPPLGVPWTAISIAPFTLGLLQYALEVDAGRRASRRRSCSRPRAARNGSDLVRRDLGGGVLDSERLGMRTKPTGIQPSPPEEQPRSRSSSSSCTAGAERPERVAPRPDRLRRRRRLRPAQRRRSWSGPARPRPLLRRRRPERRRHHPGPDQAQQDPAGRRRANRRR